VGVELRISGDDNHNATCSLKYRRIGTQQWATAQDMYRIDYLPDSPVKNISDHFNGFAGSIFSLPSGETYELSLEITDPDGGSTTRLLSVTTKDYPQKPRNGRVFHVIPGNGGGNGSVATPFLGIQEAQAHATPGDTFLLHDGFVRRL
jgi:hypothetical protein